MTVMTRGSKILSKQTEETVKGPDTKKVVGLAE